MDERILYHNWRSPLSVRLEWQTAIHASVNGEERRVALRKSPKVYFTYHLSEPLSYYYMREIARSSGFVTPLWWVKSSLDSTTQGGETTLYMKDAQLGVPPYIWTKSHGFLSVDKRSATPQRIDLDDDLLEDMPEGTQVWAAYPVKVTAAPDTTFHTGTVSETESLSMMILGEYSYPDQPDLDDVGEHFLRLQPNKASPDSTTSAALFQDFLMAGGADYRLQMSPRARETHAFSYTLSDRDEVYQMWRAVGALRGREVGFTLGTWRLLPLVGSSPQELEFEYTPDLLALLQDRFVLIRGRDGSIDPVYIHQSSESQGLIVSSTSSPSVFEPSKVVVMPLVDARLSEDAVEFIYLTSEVAQTHLGFIEV